MLNAQANNIKAFIRNIDFYGNESPTHRKASNFSENICNEIHFTFYIHIMKLTDLGLLFQPNMMNVDIDFSWNYGI